MTAVQGQPVHAESDLAKALLDFEPGDTVTLDVRRGRRAPAGAREAGRAAARRAAAAADAATLPRVLQPVAVGSKTLADYTHIVGRDLVEEIRELAEPLKGSRVVHVSATAFGGGVSEILYTLVPLMKDVGLDVEWQVIYGREEFFNATKLMHNALQGAPEDLSDEQWDTWRRYNEMNARELVGGWDVALIHDPQPAALHTLVPEKARGWCWRCHIDMSSPNPDTMGKLLPYIATYPQSVFHVRDYVPVGMGGNVNIVPPAIDPLAPKNMALSPEDAAYVCEQFGIDVDRPLMTQVSRFDPWKDPLGVIDAYRIVKEKSRRSSSPWSARWPPTTPRAGTSSTPPSRTPTATRTSTSSTTSTTSARSRSTPSSRSPTCSSRSPRARASASP